MPGDTRPVPLLLGGGIALALGWTAFALGAASAPVVLVLIPLQGALSFAVGATLIARALYAADGAPTLGGSFATASLNVGAAAGPWVGGRALATEAGATAPLWVSAGLVGLALVIAAVARVRTRIG